MPISLKDFRNWLSGDVVNGLPHRELPMPVSPPGPERLKAKTKKERPSAERSGSKKSHERFDLLLDASGKVDVELGFGRHKGNRVSDIVKTAEGRSYISWMESQSFDEELMTPVLRILAEYNATKSSGRRSRR